MLMIDNLLEHNETYTRTNFKIEKDNIFVLDGELMESGIIENIAQSAAAGAGYYCLQKSLPRPLTYIAAISKLKINKYPKVGSLVQTQIEFVKTILDVSIIVGSCFLGNELIAQCEMKIMMGTNPV